MMIFKDDPDYVEYNEDGSISIETWIDGGKHHREDGPAYIIYNRNRTIHHAGWHVKGNYIKMEPYMHLFKPNTWEFKDKESQVIFKLSVTH